MTTAATGHPWRWRAAGWSLAAAAMLLAAWVMPAGADVMVELRTAPAVRLDVTQTYRYRERASITPKVIDRFKLPLAEAAEDLLLSAGVGLAETSGAVLTVAGEGEALGGLLFGELEGFLYTGALVRGTIAFAIDGEVAYETTFAGRVERRRSLQVNLGYEDPANAPFADALATAGSYYDRIAGAIGAVYGAPALIAAVDDTGSMLRPFAARVLGDLGDRAAVPVLIAALGDADRDVRWQAAWSLGRLGDPTAIEPLIAVLGDRDQDVRWFSAWSLAAISGQSFGDDADAWRSWWLARAGE